MHRSILLALILLPPLAAQSFEVSGAAGYGVAERNPFGHPGVPAAGFTFAWPSGSRHKFQFDYAFGHIEQPTVGGLGPARYNRHFFTGSYVLQSRHGRARPFAQFGAGVQYETNNFNDLIQRYFPSNDFRTVFAGLLGAGLTIELGRSIFLRPEIRTYLAPGPSRTVDVTALPLISAGLRF